jgi:hypothetical protein
MLRNIKLGDKIPVKNKNGPPYSLSDFNVSKTSIVVAEIMAFVNEFYDIGILNSPSIKLSLPPI